MKSFRSCPVGKSAAVSREASSITPQVSSFSVSLFFIAAWFVLLPGVLTAKAASPPPRPPIALGKLEPFWRYSAALGPFLESGYPLVEIPDYLQRGDFPYRKRPFPKEVPFADHLSIVRLLGGCSAKGDAPVGATDLACRDAQGKIQYRMELLKPRLQPYLDQGYKDFTLVLDNVPWCFPEKPEAGSSLGQSSPPRDSREWQDFIHALCLELKNIMGPDAGQHLRFRVGTENNALKRFNGSQEQFQEHYTSAATAVREVFPDAKFGAFNISSANVRNLDRNHNVKAFQLAEYCLPKEEKPVAPFDWVAFSRYYRPGDNPVTSANGCREVWEEFERRVPQLAEVSREIHEFGIAPFGEVEKGEFISAEPGALGAALTSQMMWRLREAGIDRLWHWPLEDKFRNRANQRTSLFTSQAWLLSVMEYMVGGETFLFDPLEQSPARTNHLMAASFQKDRILLMISAYNTDSSNHAVENVKFHIPSNLPVPSPLTARFVRLSPENSPHDAIRRDLAEAGLLNKDFSSRPDRLGTVREMGTGREAEKLVGDRLENYTNGWVESLTLKPLNDSIGKIEQDPSGTTLTLSLSAPEVLVIELR